MCFKTPKIPDAPAVPSRGAEEAKRRSATELALAQQAKGRAATILTTPLGDSTFGEKVARTSVRGSSL